VDKEPPVFVVLDEIDDGGRDLDHPLRLDDLVDQDRNSLVTGPVRLQGRLDPGPAGIRLRAHLEAMLRLRCSRCLEPFDQPLRAPIRLTLVGEPVECGPGEKAMSADDAELFYAEGGRADLSRIAGEQIHLQLPLKPVCRPDCLGLCPTCGGNRNSIECGCRGDEVDPRLAPLRDWKKLSEKTGDS
jgi:uncharacterized protein